MVVLSLAVVVVATRRLQQNTSTVGTSSFAAVLTPKDPNFTEFQGSLAPGFPDFPVYPGARISSSRKETRGTDGVNGFSADWTVGGDNVITEIAGWYTNELTKQGWKKVSVQDENDLTEQSLKFSKAGQSIVLSIGRGESANPYTISILVDIPVDKL